MPTRFPPDPLILVDALVSVAAAAVIVEALETLIWVFG
jgi:hypothetical protein